MSWAAVVAWSLGDWVHGYEIGYWFTKLTHWSAVLQLAYHAVAVYTTGVVVLRASSEAGARTNPSFVVATLVLQSVMLPISFMVCLLYWTLGFGGTLHALSNFTHGVNFVAMAFDGLINRQPVSTAQVVPRLHATLLSRRRHVRGWHLPLHLLHVELGKPERRPRARRRHCPRHHAVGVRRLRVLLPARAVPRRGAGRRRARRGGDGFERGDVGAALEA